MATTTQTSTVEPQAANYLYGTKGILPRAQALSEQPLNLPDYQLASFTQPQLQAFGVAQGGIGDYMPALTAATNATGYGLDALSYGMGLVPQVLSNAYPYQMGSAASGFGSTAAYNPATAYQAYMNPYLDEVIRKSEEDISRYGDIQAQGLRARSVGAGAFGGSRQGVEERELGRNIADQQARTASGLRASAYEQAQQQAQQNFEQQQQRMANFASLLGNLGTAYGQLGLQGAQQYGSMAQGIGSLGANLGNLAELGQTLNIRDVGTLMDIGNVQQAQAQGVLDTTRQNQYQRTMAPYQQLGFFSDIYQGMPIGTTQKTNTPDPSLLSQIGGLAYGIASLGGL